MTEFFEPLQHDFMRDALVVGTMVATMCAVLSCFLVLKGWSLMGDAVSHAVLPGIVLAYIMGLPLAIGAFVAGLFCAVGTGFIKQNSRIKEDTVMGVVFTGLFAFGLVLFSRSTSDMHLDHILVGNILGAQSQIWQTLGLGGVVLGVTLIWRRDLLLICFDPGQARVMALPDRFLNYLLLGLLSLAIVVSLQAVGIILVVAMLVTPAATAQLLAVRFTRMMLLAAAVGVVSAVIGLYLSYWLDVASGATIVLVQTSMFALALVFGPRGLLGLRAARTGAAGAAT